MNASQFKNQVLKNIQLQGGGPNGSNSQAAPVKLESSGLSDPSGNPLVSPSAGGSSAYVSSKENRGSAQGG